MKITEGRKVAVQGFDTSKCKKDRKVTYVHTYENVTAIEFKIISREQITSVYGMDESSIDEYNEYSILILANGNTATFPNSRTDIFIL